MAPKRAAANRRASTPRGGSTPASSSGKRPASALSPGFDDVPVPGPRRRKSSTGYLGVYHSTGDRFGAQVHNPDSRLIETIGTFRSAELAALFVDARRRQICLPGSEMNFPPLRPSREVITQHFNTRGTQVTRGTLVVPKDWAEQLEAFRAERDVRFWNGYGWVTRKPTAKAGSRASPRPPAPATGAARTPPRDPARLREHAADPATASGRGDASALELLGAEAAKQRSARAGASPAPLRGGGGPASPGGESAPALEAGVFAGTPIGGAEADDARMGGWPALSRGLSLPLLAQVFSLASETADRAGSGALPPPRKRQLVEPASISPAEVVLEAVRLKADIRTRGLQTVLRELQQLVLEGAYGETTAGWLRLLQAATPA